LLRVCSDISGDINLMCPIAHGHTSASRCPNAAGRDKPGFAHFMRAASLCSSNQNPRLATRITRGVDRPKPRQNMPMFRTDADVDQVNAIADQGFANQPAG
jgi:hypothetical protein